MRRQLTTATIIFCLLLLASAASGQQPDVDLSVDVSGVVRDASGAVLAGVTVEAFSPALTERSRTVITDVGGRYRFVNLPHGMYTVTFSLAGFNAIKRDGLEVKQNSILTIDVEMSAAPPKPLAPAAPATPNRGVSAGWSSATSTTSATAIWTSGKTRMASGFAAPTSRSTTT